MARKTKEQRWAEIHEQASRELNQIVEAVQDDRDQAKSDRRFYSIPGAMWEGKFGAQFANRAQLEINKIHLSVIRIINEYRNNRITSKFVPKDSKDDNALADLCDGLYRADKEDSGAQEAIDNAFEEAVGGGFGAFRLTNEYEDEYDEDDERQRVRWEVVPDADSTVYFDLNAKRQDKADAKFGFILTGMTRDSYEAEWGDDVTSWPEPSDEGLFDWTGPDLVYVAEYYVCEDTYDTIHSYKEIDGNIIKINEDELTDEYEQELNNKGTIKVASRKVKKRAVRKYILGGSGVLEDCGLIAGPNIPIIPVYGKRWFIDGRERFMGHVRLARDPQQLLNAQMSVLAETAALGGVETPMFTPRQVAGWEDQWRDGAVNRPAYYLVNPLEDVDGNEIPAGPVDYTRTPQIPAATAALIELSNRDIGDILGNQDNGEEMRSNISEKTVELVQTRLDGQSYIYMSNFAKAEYRAAEIWLGMGRELYSDESRTMKTVDEQGEADYVDMGEKVLSDDGVAVVENDLKRAKFDISIEIGPTSASKRSATVRALSQMLGMTDDPAEKSVISGMIMMNMDGEGIGPVRDYFRKKMVQMGVIEPTEEEAEEMQAEMQAQDQGPTAEDQFLMSEAQKSQAEAIESQAKTEKAMADAEYSKARAVKTLADIDNDAKAATLDAVKVVQDATTVPSPTGTR